MLDERRVRVTINLAGREEHVFERLAINAVGSKHTSAIQNFAEIRIANIDKGVREQLLTEGTPYFAKRPLRNTVTIEAGRQSTGLFQVFTGNITTVNVSQAPDIWLTIRAITGQFRKDSVITVSQPGSAKFSTIAERAASELELALEFDAEDKNVSNFSFSGAAEKLVGALSTISNGIDAFVDDDRLVVMPRRSATSSGAVPVNINTGLIGLPEFVDFGVRVRVLVDEQIQLGRDIELSSAAYPTTDGIYGVYKLGFNIANRDRPFYYIAEAARKESLC